MGHETWLRYMLQYQPQWGLDVELMRVVSKAFVTAV